LRSSGGEVQLTWSEYAKTVRAIAGGLASLGIGPGDTVAMMLTNRPEFHIVDWAKMHIGAIPFSVYNTSSPEQIEYLFANAGNRALITERAFLDSLRTVRAPSLSGSCFSRRGCQSWNNAAFRG
jgi:long-chain acyl-CoA synthetase